MKFWRHVSPENVASYLSFHIPAISSQLSSESGYRAFPGQSLQDVSATRDESHTSRAAAFRNKSTKQSKWNRQKAGEGKLAAVLLKEPWTVAGSEYSSGIHVPLQTNPLQNRKTVSYPLWVLSQYCAPSSQSLSNKLQTQTISTKAISKLKGTIHLQWIKDG